MKNKPIVSVFWFRRDLRLFDNAALWMALKSGHPVLPIFIFDQNILDNLSNKKDPRVLFIHREVLRLKCELEKINSSLLIFYTTPQKAFEHLLANYQIKFVFTNRDYEPYAQRRDKEIYDFLELNHIDFRDAKDHVIFEKSEIVKDDGNPYRIFTPYSKKWKFHINDFQLKSYPTEKYHKNFLHCPPFSEIKLEDMGFENFDYKFFPDQKIDLEKISSYEKNRDFPAIKGTSRLSLHLRFGTVSIRKLCRIALSQSHKWLDELIWREFYQMIIHHFPLSAEKSFKEKYEAISWQNNEEDFEKWRKGETGYPIVDAGMRELNKSGFMHNRVRMIVASFLTKHLLIDWRWGEKYFAEKLLDYELASNVGNWQWAAGSGCDASPYFRIFNPQNQLKKFDPEKKYIKKWIPEFGSEKYPEPMIDHKFARNRCLKVFGKALKIEKDEI